MLDKLNSKLGMAEDSLNLKTGQYQFSNVKSRENKELVLKWKGHSDLWDNIKQSGIHATGVPEGEEPDNEKEKDIRKNDG